MVMRTQGRQLAIPERKPEALLQVISSQLPVLSRDLQHPSAICLVAGHPKGCLKRTQTTITTPLEVESSYASCTGVLTAQLGASSGRSVLLRLDFVSVESST